MFLDLFPKIASARHHPEPNRAEAVVCHIEKNQRFDRPTGQERENGFIVSKSAIQAKSLLKFAVLVELGDVHA